MADNENAELKTPSEQEEAILLIGMIRVVKLNGAFINKNSLCFLEGNAVPPPVRLILAFIPGDREVGARRDHRHLYP